MGTTPNDETNRRLEELLVHHPEFLKLSANDATVHSWLKTAMSFQNRDYVGSAEDVLVGIIVALGRDKQNLFDEAIKRAQNCTCNTKNIRV